MWWEISGGECVCADLCLMQQDHHPHWSNAWTDSLYEGMPTPAMSDVWLECFSRLPELPHLESVVLVFDRHGGSNDGDDDDEDLLHTREAREKGQFGLFKLLGGRVRELGIRHVQLTEDRDDEEEEEQESRVQLRKRILGNLTALRLAVVHEQPRGEAGTVYQVNLPSSIGGEDSPRVKVHWAKRYRSRIVTNAGLASQVNGSRPRRIICAV